MPLGLNILAWLIFHPACLLADTDLQQPVEFEQLDVVVVVSPNYSPADLNPSLLIHFHGAPATTERNFHQAQPTDILITVNCRGLSSAYRRPFENRQLFSYLIEHARQQMVSSGRLNAKAEWKWIGVSCFSAGYGAVREILKMPEAVQRIDAVVAADSIYASIHVDAGQRNVDEAQMKPFLDFARRATANEKTFLISHSQLPVEAYASTVETTEYLLDIVNIARMLLRSDDGAQGAPLSVAKGGRLNVLSYPGADGESHMEHLRQIERLWKMLRKED